MIALPRFQKRRVLLIWLNTASLMHRKGVPALVIKDQLRHTNVKTTVDFYIGSDVDYQREMIEKLILNSGKR
jgi:hypothetical protein